MFKNIASFSFSCILILLHCTGAIHALIAPIKSSTATRTDQVKNVGYVFENSAHECQAKDCSRLNLYVDSCGEYDVVPMTSSSLVSREAWSLPATTDTNQALPTASAVSVEPKPWELPANSKHYSNNGRQASQTFLDLEMQIGRASICLALVLFGTELGTGYSLPELVNIWVKH